MNNDRLVNICVYGKWYYIKFSKLIDMFRIYSSIENIIDFVESNETCEPIWEFRLGA